MLRSILFVTESLLEVLLWVFPLVSKLMVAIAILWIVWLTFSRIYDLFID